MREILIQEDIKIVEEKIREFETNTGCELLLVVAKESDPYPAAPLRFGIFTSFALALSFSYFLDYHHNFLWPVSILLATLVCMWIGTLPVFKRLALSATEVHRETLEKAIEQFHVLGTSKVSHKVTAMIFVSVLERKIHVLVDEKLKSELSQAELDELVSIMRTHFKDGNMALGFIQSMKSLEEKILKDFGRKLSDVSPSQLTDTIQFI